MTSASVRSRTAVVLTVLAAVSAVAWVSARQSTGAIAIDPDDIAGVVSGANGPEAGVWVIAETADLPTKFARIVVTDEAGRYLVPDLPRGATYSVWVRGYGLSDSPRVRVTPGSRQNLTATTAPTPQEAARIYPANYWFSLLKLPSADAFPGTRAEGNGFPPTITSQAAFVSALRFGCLNCHQLGNQATRAIPKTLGTFESSVAAWDHRVKVGQSGLGMSSTLTRLGRAPAL